MKKFMALAVVAIVTVLGVQTISSGAAVFAAKGAAGGAETRLLAPLHATPDGGLMSGKADYRAKGTSSRLNIQVEDAADGSYAVAIWRPGQASAVFQGTVAVAAGLGETQLSTDDGQAVPVIQGGDVVQVFSPGGALVLSGNF